MDQDRRPLHAPPTTQTRNERNDSMSGKHVERMTCGVDRPDAYPLRASAPQASQRIQHPLASARRNGSPFGRACGAGSSSSRIDCKGQTWDGVWAGLDRQRMKLEQATCRLRPHRMGLKRVPKLRSGCACPPRAHPSGPMPPVPTPQGPCPTCPPLGPMPYVPIPHGRIPHGPNQYGVEIRMFGLGSRIQPGRDRYVIVDQLQKLHLKVIDLFQSEHGTESREIDIVQRPIVPNLRPANTACRTQARNTMCQHSSPLEPLLAQPNISSPHN